MLLYRVSYLRKDLLTPQLREKLKIQFILCENPLEPYFVALEPVVKLSVLKRFTSGEIKKLSRILGVRILRWGDVHTVRPDLHLFEDPKFLTRNEWEKRSHDLKARLAVDKELRNDDQIRADIDQLYKDTMGYSDQ